MPARGMPQSTGRLRRISATVGAETVGAVRGCFFRACLPLLNQELPRSAELSRRAFRRRAACRAYFPRSEELPAHASAQACSAPPPGHSCALSLTRHAQPLCRHPPTMPPNRFCGTAAQARFLCSRGGVACALRRTVLPGTGHRLEGPAHLTDPPFRKQASGDW